MSKVQEYFFSPADRKLLQANNFGNFSKLWQAELEWFEPPNYRRSGWSGAARHELQLENGKTIGVFIKRQENHLRRTLQYPQGCPTFRIEWQNLNKSTKHQIAVPHPLYYGERYVDGKPQAVLITYELKGFSALDEWLRGDQCKGGNQYLRKEVLPTIADVVRRFHDHHFRHNSLYPKHIMLKVHQDGDLTTTDVSLIDLEKSRRVFYPTGARIRDLDTLMRRCPEWTSHEKDLFFNYYLKAGLENLPPAQLADELWKIPLVKSIKRRIVTKLKK
ncbi:MAG: hypothetical protein J7L25_02455 [Deltaproteobacteria bacterium]|nr:hypothetical protein [Candidatus Tharpella aukensis]